VNRKSAQLGFTLVELLVVIAIIAVLVSLLLPSLDRAKNQAFVVKCLAHQRQLITAWTGYTADNDGELVGAHNGHPHGWIHYPQDESGNVDTSSKENRFRGLRRGAFFNYIGNLGVYRCPAANNDYDGPNSGSYRTYMMAGGLNGEYLPWYEFDHIKNPSGKYVFIESVSPVGWDVGAWTISVPNGPFQGSWFNSLTVLHRDQSALGFVDGHAEVRLWRDPRTTDMEFGFFKPSFREQIDNPDYLFMRRHFPHDPEKLAE
jgi:prepilin-type N-terminal cleavage/methylation domain-containing protein